MFKSQAPAEYLATIDNDKCIRCKRCIQNCGWDTYAWGGDRVLIDTSKCVKCLRCYHYCPTEAIPLPHRGDTDSTTRPSSRITPYWSYHEHKKPEEAGGVRRYTGLREWAATCPIRYSFDNLLIDACQVTNPSIDPLREPMELRTYLGSKPDRPGVHRRVQVGASEVKDQDAAEYRSSGEYRSSSPP